MTGKKGNTNVQNVELFKVRYVSENAAIESFPASRVIAEAVKQALERRFEAGRRKGRYLDRVTVTLVPAEPAAVRKVA